MQTTITSKDKLELVDLLDRTGVNQQDLAKPLGISNTGLYRILKGLSPVPDDFRRRCAEAVRNIAADRHKEAEAEFQRFQGA